MFTININKQTKIKKDIKSLKSSDILSKGTTEKKSQKGEKENSLVMFFVH